MTQLAHPVDDNGQSSTSIGEKCELQAVGIDGTSGHSQWRRLRFAFAAYGPFAAMFIVFFAKDMYILKLGADTGRAATIAAVWSLVFPVAYPIAGHLMDRESRLQERLERSGWGRRAPWFLSHLIPAAIVCFCIFMPGFVWVPGPGSFILDLWLALCLLVSAWCLPVLLNAIESARAEIYPFKEERVVVEALTKFIGVFASASGIVPQFILWINASLAVRFACSCFLLVCVSLSLEAVPVLKDAKQPHTKEERASFRDSLAVLRNLPMTHATFVRFWHSAADTTYLNFSIYYLTFVNALDSAKRAQWMFICGIFVAIMELGILTPFWGYMWGSSTAKSKALCPGLSRSMQSTCFVLHALGAFLPPLCLRLLPEMGVQRPWEWIVYSLLLRFCYSPQAFFRTASFCWAVDVDCHGPPAGRRREAVHAGVVKFFEDEGRALAFAVFLGLGWAGLETENCELLCEGAGDRDSCVQACDQRDIARQAAAVPDYITAVLTYVVPVFGLICALHIWFFPIHGKRLDELQQTQAVVFKNVRSCAAEPVLVGSHEHVQARSHHLDQ